MSSKQTRKELRQAYKEQPPLGGVYTITNMTNGKYLLAYVVNLKSAQNHFQFAMKTGSTIHPRLQEDQKASGANVFTLEILEELERKPQQSQAAFLDDLKTLEQLWRARLDASKAY